MTAIALWLPWSLAPETQPDAYEYFLAGPDRWLRAHGLTFSGAAPTQSYPALAEILYAFPVAAGLEGGVKLLNAGMLLCGACSLALATIASGAGRWAGLALLVTTSTGAGLFATGKNEGFGAGFLMLSLACGISGRASTRSVLLSGILAGGGLSTKLLAGINEAWLPLVLIPAWWRAPRSLVMWSCSAILMASPWWSKAWILTGDPWYPLVTGTFPGLFPGRDARHADVWRLTSGGSGFHPWFPAGACQSLISEHVAAAALLPVLLMAPGMSRRIVLAATTLYAAWFALFPPNQIMRWAFPALSPAIVLVGAAGVAWSSRVTWRPPVLALLIILGWVGAVTARRGDPNPFPYVLGTESGAAHVRRHFTSFDVFRGRLARTPTQGALLLVGDVRTYGMPHPTRIANRSTAGAPMETWSLSRESRSPDHLARKFRQLGITRVAVDPVALMRGGPGYAPFTWSDRQIGVFAGYVGRWWELVSIPETSDQVNGAHYVYRIRSAPIRTAIAPLGHLPGLESELARVALVAPSPQQGVRQLLAYLSGIPRVLQFETYAGNLALKAGEPDLAYRLTRESVKRGWLDGSNLYVHAVASLLLRDYASATRALTLARAGWPGWEDWSDRLLTETRFHQGLQLIEQGRMQAAVLHLTTAIAALAQHPPRPWIAPRRGLLKAARALALMNLGRGHEATAELAGARDDLRDVPLRPDPGILQEFLTSASSALLPAVR